jgi:hypothetical protein
MGALEPEVLRTFPGGPRSIHRGPFYSGRLGCLRHPWGSYWRVLVNGHSQTRDVRTGDDGPHSLPRLPRSAGLLQFDLVQPQRKLTLDWLPDDTALLDLDSRMVCSQCGLVGANVRRPSAVSGLPNGASQRAVSIVLEVQPSLEREAGAQSVGVERQRQAHGGPNEP